MPVVPLKGSVGASGDLAPLSHLSLPLIGKGEIKIDNDIVSSKSALNKINLNEKLSKISKYWSPRIIAEMNDYQFKLVKIKGEFIWHDHKDTDEAFIVIEGNMNIEFQDGIVDLSEGEMYVVPKGVTHKTYAENECKVMLVEPTGVKNTGEAGGDLTAPNDVWV